VNGKLKLIPAGFDTGGGGLLVEPGGLGYLFPTPIGKWVVG
jgi:hypothetical protein